MPLIDLQVDAPRELPRRAIRFFFENFTLIKDRLSPGDGITDTFTTTDGKTVTVTNGVITNIV